MRYVIIIPAFNAAPYLEELITRTRRSAPGIPVTVIDDGSADGTAEVAEHFADRVLRHPENKGKGAALKTAFADALETPIDAVVHLDADLQHEPESLPHFFAAFETGNWDVLVGTRDFRAGHMPWSRRTTNRITSWAISKMTGMDVPDSQSGYRLIARPVLETIRPESDLYDYESEYLIRAGQAGYKIGSVPIATVYEGKPSFIRPLRDTFRFIRLVGLYWGK
ncbi:MAG: glycosyltransferase family 2 protein [Candidatus Zixiibacteriota bacterium]